MKRAEFAKRIAKKLTVTPGAAADQLDQIVHEILHKVRRGQTADVPGLGTFILDPKTGLGIEMREPQRERKRR